MSKFNGLFGEENPLLLLLTTAAEAPVLDAPEGVDDDFLLLAEGDVGVKLQEALTLLPPAWILLLVILLLLVIRSETTVL